MAGGLPKGVPHNYPKERAVTPAVIEACDKAREASHITQHKRMEERQSKFLDAYKEIGSLTKTCKITELGISTVAAWIQNDPEFNTEYYKLKDMWDLIRVEDAEDFLHEVGTGERKCTKETGINMASVVAAKMGLAARQPLRWSEKLYKEEKVEHQIKTIVVHLNDPPHEIKDGEFTEIPEKCQS